MQAQLESRSSTPLCGDVRSSGAASVLRLSTVKSSGCFCCYCKADGRLWEAVDLTGLFVDCEVRNVHEGIMRLYTNIANNVFYYVCFMGRIVCIRVLLLRACADGVGCVQCAITFTVTLPGYLLLVASTVVVPALITARPSAGFCSHECP